jgi:ribosomal protein L11 methyltransferase
MAAASSGAAGADGVDRSVRVTIPEALAEEAGAILMDVLGPFEEERPGHDHQESGRIAQGEVTLVFYPPAEGPSSREELLPLLPLEFSAPGVLRVQTAEVARDWVDGWRRHFRPIVIGVVRIRPPWEPVSTARQGRTQALVDVVINPGLGFGTGLHPTTRGTLLLLQEEVPIQPEGPGSLGRLVDVGTGSGILAIAAAKLGWRPVIAVDNDPVAVVSAEENIMVNGVKAQVEVHEADAATVAETWFHDATVLANMTLEPVSLLVRRLACPPARPRRLVVSGILAGSQEEQLMLTAHAAGFAPGRRRYEDEWVSVELLPGGSRGAQD